MGTDRKTIHDMKFEIMTFKGKFLILFEHKSFKNSQK